MLNVGVGEVLKQAMKLAATSTLVRMDVSKLTDADNNGATLLMRGIAALKRAKKEFVFGSPAHLAQILQQKLVVGERANQEMWLLLLELHQQAFHQEAFEEVAVNYAITFEVSPPSWEAPPPRSEEAVKAHNLSPLARIVGSASAAQAPELFTTAPAKAISAVLAKTKLALTGHAHTADGRLAVWSHLAAIPWTYVVVADEAKMLAAVAK